MQSGGTGKDEPITEINVTPLVDVCLVLVIIFMAIAPFAVQAGIKVVQSQTSVGVGKVSSEENVKVELYGQPMSIKQLGSLGIRPPRSIEIAVWDKGAAAAVAKAIEDAKAGFTVINEGIMIRASLSALSNERREELGKLAKKTIEGARIEVRAARDEAMKKVKAAGDRKEINEDQVFSGKEKMQKQIDAANKEMERLLEEKLEEIAE